MRTSKPDARRHVERINILSPDNFASRHYPAPLRIIKHTSSLDSNAECAFFKIALKAQSELSPPELEACFRLIEETSADDYAASKQGWKPEEKLEEMQDADMRYLIVTRETSGSADLSNGNRNADEPHMPCPLAGFLSFMITIEDSLPVLYVYEIHTASNARRQGLGDRLMGIAEVIARSSEMRKVMLTVFTRNEGARKFYARCGFEVDEFSPKVVFLRGGKVKRPQYEILSKVIEAAEARSDAPD